MRKPYKGQAYANEVDTITNAVETFDNEMLVDEMYQIGENDQLAHEPLFKHWDEDQVYETDQPVTGSSHPFQFGSLSPML